MGRLQLLFEGETVDEVIADMEQWIAGNRRNGTSANAGSTAKAFSWDTPEFRDALNGLGGRHARKLLVRIAEAALRDDRVHNTRELQQEFGVKSGIGFAGVIGPLNLRMKNRVGRKLVEGQWENDHASWTMDKEAAKVVLGMGW